MNAVIQELLDHLILERLEDNLFRGPSRDIGTDRVYGGQVLGQALKAAQYTVDNREIHSLHAYFLREGDHNAPIIYDVDRSRDGNSFSARRVVAIQHGRPIFTLAASFQKIESGLEFQTDMPNVPGPAQLAGINEYRSSDVNDLPDKIRRLIDVSAPFDLRPVRTSGKHSALDVMTCRQFWIKTVDDLPDDGDLHRAILAYISDYSLLTTAVQPHDVGIFDRRLRLASIDHAMWFHRPFQMDRWLLCDYEAVSTSNARGIARGSIYQEDGRLVVTTSQEGLMRIRTRP